MCYYYITTTNFQKGITIPADVYHYIDLHPKNVSLIINNDSNVSEILGENIKVDVDKGEISVYPKTYFLTNDNLT